MIEQRTPSSCRPPARERPEAPAQTHCPCSTSRLPLPSVDTRALPGHPPCDQGRPALAASGGAASCSAHPPAGDTFEAHLATCSRSSCGFWPSHWGYLPREPQVGASLLTSVSLPIHRAWHHALPRPGYGKVGMETLPFLRSLAMRVWISSDHKSLRRTECWMLGTSQENSTAPIESYTN